MQFGDIGEGSGGRETSRGASGAAKTILSQARAGWEGGMGSGSAGLGSCLAGIAETPWERE